MTHGPLKGPITCGCLSTHFPWIGAVQCSDSGSGTCSQVSRGYSRAVTYRWKCVNIKLKLINTSTTMITITIMLLIANVLTLLTMQAQSSLVAATSCCSKFLLPTSMTTTMAMPAWTANFQKPLKWLRTLLTSHRGRDYPTNPNDLARIQQRFFGHFNNDAQVAHNLRIGRRTPLEGGHENVYASFHPFEHNNSSMIVAQYFYDNCIAKTFRYRVYQLLRTDDATLPAVTSVTQGVPVTPGSVVMKIYRPTAACLAELQQNGFANTLTSSSTSTFSDQFDYVDGCDVVWSRHGRISAAALAICDLCPKLFNTNNSLLGRALHKIVRYRGQLVRGTVEVASARDPQRRVLVRDDLRLFHDALWTDDRVYSTAPDGGQSQLIVGNTLGVPYKFIRALHAHQNQNHS